MIQAVLELVQEQIGCEHCVYLEEKALGRVDYNREHTDHICTRWMWEKA